MHRPLLLFAFVTSLLLSPITAHCQEKNADPIKLAQAISPSLVRVEYELQFDKADAPTGALGNERCPNCGNYHGDELRNYLEEQRPVETTGYLVANDRVITVDPLIHGRFIKSIVVKAGGHSIAARMEAFARDQKAVMLSLSSTLPDTRPLNFTPKPEGPLKVVRYGRESGRWVTSVSAFPTDVSVSEGEPLYVLTSMKGIAVAPDGTPVGLLLNSRIPLDNSWQGSPLQWPFVTSSDLSDQLTRLKQATAKSVVRVALSFRSPKTGTDSAQRFQSHSYGDDEPEDSTERSVIGLLLPENRVLVLANLKARVTARLERIVVHPRDGQAVPAKFSATLREFGAFVASLDTPLTGAADTASMDLPTMREQLLLRTDVSVQGETRAEYFQSDRIHLCKVGPRGRLYPELDGPQPENAFLFTTNLQLVALPVVRRDQVSGDRFNYDRPEVMLTPAAYLAEAIRGLPETADLNNTPVSEDEENRLAWLGVELQPLNRELARANQVSDQTRDGKTGALVTYVHPGSPAAKAGIETGAILLRLNVVGQALPVEVQLEEDSMRSQTFPWDRLDEVQEQYFDRIPTPWPAVENTFIRALTDLGFGTRYSAEFFVNGSLVSKDFEVVAGPAHYDAAPRYKSDSLGVTVRNLTYDVRRYLQRSAEDPGVVVAKIEPGSKVSVAGLKPYEVITHINDQPVTDVEKFATLTAAGGEMKFSIKRMTKGRIITVQAGPK